MPAPRSSQDLSNERPPPKVFISYSHDNAQHMTFVRELADRLRADGVESWIDQYHGKQGSWIEWMLQLLAPPTFVLIVCTDVYRRRLDGNEEPERGKGTAFEGALIFQQLYDNKMKNDRFIPVLPDGVPDSAVHVLLRGYKRFELMSEYEACFRLITDQPEFAAPPLGPLRRPAAIPQTAAAPLPLLPAEITTGKPVPGPAVAPSTHTDVAGGSPGRNTRVVRLFVADSGCSEGSSMAVVACLVTERPEAVAALFERLKEDLRRDPALGAIASVKAFAIERGVTVSADSDIRARVFERLGRMTAQIFACCRPIAAGERPVDVFHQLLGRLLFDRMRKDLHARVEVAVAESGVTKTSDDVTAVARLSAAAARSRHDVDAALELTLSTEKDKPVTTAAVYCSEAIKTRIVEPTSLEGRVFEHLRNKVRMIHRVDTQTFYDRRRQLP